METPSLPTRTEPSRALGPFDPATTRLTSEPMPAGDVTSPAAADRHPGASGLVDASRDVGERLAPVLPPPRGPLSAWLFETLRGRAEPGAHPDLRSPDPLGDDDLQLALYACYELHYRGFDEVDPELEWDPTILAFRAELEAVFLAGVEAAVRDLRRVPTQPERALVWLANEPVGPSLSAYAQHSATLEELRELCIHRSAYQRKEADPHTWAMPRLAGATKAALVEIQRDEYGNGVEAEMHSELFAVTMAALGLDASYGHYLARLPAITLATTNLMSLFGLHRHWRGALIGHLALFEMTSRGPMGRYSSALERLGIPAPARRFYDVHVLADAHHERVALEQLVPALLHKEPSLAADVVFGATALTAVEARFTREVLAAWASARSSLLPPAST